MRRDRPNRFVWTALAAGFFSLLPQAQAQEKPKESGWMTLFDESTGLDAFREPHGAWQVVGAAHLNPEDAKHLASDPGRGVMINDPPGRTNNLETRQSFGDVEVRLEYMLPEGSNAGIKFEGVYEIQMFDSYGKPIDASGNGDIYPPSGTPPPISPHRRWHSTLGERLETAGRVAVASRDLSGTAIRCGGEESPPCPHRTSRTQRSGHPSKTGCLLSDGECLEDQGGSPFRSTPVAG